MSVDHCASLITEKTSAIIATHLWGRPCDVEALQELASRHNIHLLVDAAHAFGCSHKGRMIGTFGDAEIFSFHATKAFHTAEGGAVTCSDATLADKLRQTRNFGFVGYDRVSGVGTNAKMSELSAAMGLANLDGFDASVELNKSVYRSYLEHLDGAAHVSLVRFDEREANNYWYISLELSGDCPIARDDVLRILEAETSWRGGTFLPVVIAWSPTRPFPRKQMRSCPTPSGSPSESRCFRVDRAFHPMRLGASATRCALLSSTRTRFSIAYAAHSSPTADELAFELLRRCARAADRQDFLKQVGHTERGRAISDAQFRAMLASLRARLDLRTDDVLLDLCCGNGVFTRHLAGHVHHAVGVDFSRDLIAIAEAHHRADNLVYHGQNVKELKLGRLGEGARVRRILDERSAVSISQPAN